MHKRKKDLLNHNRCQKVEQPNIWNESWIISMKRNHCLSLPISISKESWEIFHYQESRSPTGCRLLTTCTLWAHQSTWMECTCCPFDLLLLSSKVTTCSVPLLPSSRSQYHHHRVFASGSEWLLFRYWNKEGGYEPRCFWPPDLYQGDWAQESYCSFVVIWVSPAKQSGKLSLAKWNRIVQLFTLWIYISVQ